MIRTGTYGKTELRYGSHRTINGVTVVPVMVQLGEFDHRLVADHFLIVSMLEADLSGGAHEWLANVVNDYLSANCRGMSEAEWANHEIPDLLN
ncbi:MAG: hypothetical protein LCH59_00915 [Proteobacteria bacterium]|nr:hypothetical protein [Pseudomonadota bacterium]